MFEKHKRITKNKEFDKVFKTGRSSYNQILGIKIIKNDLPYNRFGIIISNKVSKKAVVRNKTKRQLRAILKKHSELKQGYDIIIIVLPEIIGKEYKEIEEAVIFNLKRLRLAK